VASFFPGRPNNWRYVISICLDSIPVTDEKHKPSIQGYFDPSIQNILSKSSNEDQADYTFSLHLLASEVCSSPENRSPACRNKPSFFKEAGHQVN
jgi:hypothetical protein